MEAGSISRDLKVQVTNRQILSIALPITLAILIPQINMLTNSIFLGNLSMQALGDAGITGVFYLIFAVAGHGLNNAVQSVLSRHAGADDHAAFKVILAQGIRISLIFATTGILFTWLIAPSLLQAVADPAAYPTEISFLRIRIFGLPFLYLFQMGNAFLVASLNSRWLMIGFIAEALVNIALDYLLIFGKAGFPALGFNGAAWASVIAEATGAVVVLWVLVKTGLRREYRLLENFQYARTYTRSILKVAIPLVSQFMISVTTWLAFFFLIESLHDEKAKAISNTMRNVFGLGGVFIWAFAGTTNNMVSNLIGQGRQADVMRAIQLIMFWSLGLCTLMVIGVNLFPEWFFALFGQNEAFIEAGIPVLRMVSVAMLIMAMGNIWLNGVTGTGKTTMNLAIEIIAITLYMIYTWYFTHVHFISLAMCWSNELVYWSGIFLMSYLYLKSGKWKRSYQ